MGRWFGSSGIRGPFPDPISPSFAIRLGAATASISPELLLGHDVRLTSPALSSAFTAGALSMGARVTLAGGAATPSIAYAARRHQAAIVITASHNPPPDNGFKFWNPDGSAWAPTQETQLEARLDAPTERPPWDRLTAPEADTAVTERHTNALLKFGGSLSGPIVLDCGNGAGSWISPHLLQEAGATVHPLFCAPDGRFPNRPSEPSLENLGQLRQSCAKEKAWGVAHDGDADRMSLIDPQGQWVPPERILVALALLRKARRLATPIDCPLSLQKALPGVQVDLTKVGDAAVSATLKEKGGDVGGETSGTFIVPRFSFTPDGPLAALLAMQAALQGLLDEAARRLGQVHRRSEKVALGPVSRHTFSARLNVQAERTGERATRVDGIRLDSDAGMVLVRPSGTEPIARITAEAWREADLTALLERGRSLVAGALKAP